ncbi:MAG: hypothetical protein FH748_03315 [Balneolaceae bacterium]|nr:hypothetical protein [Balneolaceae bacterium]
MDRPKKILISTGSILFFAYLCICGYFYVIQEAIIFRTSPLDDGYTYKYRFPFEERWFEPEEGVRIHAIHAFADSAKGLVMYFHGNQGMNRSNPAKYELFLENGYDVLYPDYRQYGKSRGELRNEADLVGDMNFVYSEVLGEYDEDEIILLGYSLGAGVAAQVAVANDPKMLIMWTPFYSLLDMKDSRFPFLPDFLVRYPLRNDLALQQISEPVHIFYAAEDRVLPVERSLPLTKFLKAGDHHYVLKGQGHGRVYRNRELVNRIEEILRP